jgi:hypothetical protein
MTEETRKPVKKQPKKTRKSVKKPGKVKVNGPALDTKTVSLKDIPDLPGTSSINPDIVARLNYEAANGNLTPPEIPTTIDGPTDCSYVRGAGGITERYLTQEDFDRQNREIAKINSNFTVGSQVQTSLSYHSLMKSANDLPGKIVASITSIPASQWRYHVRTDGFRASYTHSTLSVELDLDYGSKECRVSYLDEGFTQVDYIATFKDLDALYAAGQNGQKLCNWLARTIHGFYK